MLDWNAIRQFWSKRALAQASGVVGLCRYEEGIAIAHGERDGDGQWHVRDADFQPVTGEQAQANFVNQWIRERRLAGAVCHYVLNPKDYELLLLEAPPVEDSELLDAALWRVKDLIKQPIEEMAVDVMRLPTDAYRGRMNMIYAVCAKKNDIKSIVRFIKQCELTPDVIDIPEMCMRNLLAYIEDADVGSVATLGLRRSSGEMVIYSHDAMYLTRQIEAGIKNFQMQTGGGLSLDNGLPLDQLSLDIQRSLDYYESQLGKGTVKRIYFLPITDEHLELVDDLSSLVTTPIESFSIYKSVSLGFDKTLTPKEQAYCIPVMGAALRIGVQHAAS